MKSNSITLRKRKREIGNDLNSSLRNAKKQRITSCPIIEERNTCTPVLLRYCLTFGKVLAQSPKICGYCTVPTGPWSRKKGHKKAHNSYRIDLNQAFLEEN